MIVSYFTEEDWIKEKKKKKDFEKILKLLCEDKRTSLNQQDGNGFTALIKACANGNAKCRDILINAGADTKIVDLNGHNYEDHWNEYLEYGPLRERNKRQDEEKR